MTSEDKGSASGNSRAKKEPQKAADKPPTPTATEQQPDDSNKAPEKTGDSGATEQQETAMHGSPEQQQGGPQKSGRLLAVIAFILALGALAGNYYIWQNTLVVRQDLGGQIGTIEKNLDDSTASVSTTRASVDEVRGQIAAIEKRVQDDATVIQSIRETVDKAASNAVQLGEAVESLHKEIKRGRRNDWLVAEAEYLMTLANQRIKLDGNTEVALAALRAADQRLRATGDPTLINIRGIVANEISALQAVQKADVPGLALIVSSLEKRVERLSLPGPVRQVAPSLKLEDQVPAGSDWTQAAWKAWDALKSLVVVRHDGEVQNEAPLLTPREATYLYQNLRLKLESARLALIEHNEPVYHDSLKTAQKWVMRYFSDNSERSGMLASIKRLNDATLVPDLPDISRSLKALRDWNANKNAGDEVAAYTGHEQQIPQSISMIVPGISGTGRIPVRPDSQANQSGQRPGTYAYPGEAS